MTAQLLFGRVWHRRLRPVRNDFAYPVIQIAFPLTQIDDLPRRLFSRNRFNLFSFHDKDHAARDGSALLPWIRERLCANGMAHVDGEIWLQTMPRMLGYVFNPISFWYCHDRAGDLRAVLCEVNNTFGGTHAYLIAHPDHRPIRPDDRFDSRKCLHVSPFCQIEGHYEFRFAIDDANTARVAIDYDDSMGPVLQTAIATTAQPMTNRALLRAFSRYRWNTLETWLRIHVQAIRLWYRGVTFRGRTPPDVHRGPHA